MPSPINPNEFIEQSPTTTGGGVSVDPGAASSALANIPGVPWSDSSGNVQGALFNVFDALNTRPTYLLDASGSTKADFSGATAISDAVTALSGIGRPVSLFLLPGTYTWNGTLLTDVVLVGSGPTTIIQSSATILIGDRTVFGNLSVNRPLNIQGTGAQVSGVTFSSVTGTQAVSITGTGNRISALQFNGTTTSSFLAVSGNHNSVSHLTVGAGSASPTAIATLSGDFNDLQHVVSTTVTLTPAIAFNVTGKGNGLSNVQVLNCNPGTFLSLAGPNSQIVSLSLTSCAATAALFAVSGDNNSIEGVSLTTCSAATRIVELTGSHNRIEQINGSGVSVSTTGTAIYLDPSSGDNSVNQVKVVSGSLGTTSTSASLLFCAGSSQEIVSLIWSGGSSNVAAIKIQGSGHRIEGIKVDSITQNSIFLMLDQALETQVSQVELYGSSVTNSLSLGRLAHFERALSCHITGLSAHDCPAFSCLSAMVTSDGSVGCSLKSLYLKNLGTTTPCGSGVFTARVVSGQTTRNFVLDGVTVDTVALAAGADLLNINASLFEELTVKNWRNTTFTSADNQARTLNIGSAGSNNQIRFSDCSFAGYAASTVEMVRISGVRSPVRFLECMFDNSLPTVPQWAVLVTGTHQAEILNSKIRGPKTVYCDLSGLLLQDSTLQSVNVGTNVQLLAGSGGADTKQSDGFVIKNCQALLTAANMRTTAVSVSADKVPAIFLGGVDNAAVANHGSIRVEGLLIRKDISAVVSSWSVTPTLTVDTANLRPGATASIKDVTIDQDGVSFPAASSVNGSVFGDIGNWGCLVELHGGLDPSSDNTRDSFEVSNLTITNLTRNAGGGTRAVVKALGVSIDGLTIDCMGSTTAADAGGPSVAMRNSRLFSADLFASSATQLGTTSSEAYHLYMVNSFGANVMVRNGSPGTTQNGFVYLDGSTLRDSKMWLKNDQHIPIGAGVIAASNNSKLLFNEAYLDHNAAGSGDSRVILGVSGTGSLIHGNIFQNLASSQASGFSSTPASSNGGACRVNIIGQNNTYSQNSQSYEWETHTTAVTSPLIVNGTSNVIDGNVIVNRASTLHSTDGGSASLEVTGGLFNRVTNNHVEAHHVTSVYFVTLLTNAGSNGYVAGNVVYNRANAGTNIEGFLLLSTSDKPEAGVAGFPVTGTSGGQGRTYNILA